MSLENGNGSRVNKPAGVLHRAVTKVIEAPEDNIENAAALLASLLNIKGSVELENYLADCEQSRPAVGPPVPVESIRARLILGTEDVRRRLNADFSTAYRPRFRLPTAARAWSTLERTSYWKAQAAKDKKIRQKVLRSTVRTLWAPFAEFIEVRVKRSLFALAELRTQLGADVRTLGETAYHLESLDMVMRQAVKPEAEALYKRVYANNEKRFETLFKTAMDELPDIADREGFNLGFSETGWLGETLRDAMELAAAICEHEINQLHVFIEAALAATTPPQDA